MADDFPLPVSRSYRPKGGDPNPLYRELVEPYTFGFLGRRVTIEAGFVWDRASIPRIAEGVIARTSLGEGPPLCHDYLYRWSGEVLCDESEVLLYDRGDSDVLFHDLMGQWGIARWRRWIAHSAVRWGGGQAWEDSRRYGADVPSWSRRLPWDLADSS